MAQKVITIILVLLVVGGLAWYFNKTYLQPSTSQNSSEKLPQFKSSATQTQAKLFYVVSDTTKEIWEVAPAKEKRKVFTDADETEKIVKLANLSSLSGEVLAITSAQTNPFSGNLIVIDLKTAKKTTLQKSFAVPSAWGFSADGKKIAFTQFSNLEENYGYTLYSEDRNGSNKRELARSVSEIGIVAWNQPSSKIAFTKTSGIKSELNIVDIETAKTEVIKGFENSLIDWLSWADNKIVFSKRDINNQNQGTIEIIDAQGENLEKITDFEGGRANFIYLENSSWLGYLVAQYPASPASGEDKINDLTTGQIYILNITENEKIPIQKGSQILGWL